MSQRGEIYIMVDKVNYLVEKSNILNQLKCPAMTLTELRFFCMYLSKLNAREKNKRNVEIPIAEFEKLFNVKFNNSRFDKDIAKVMSRTVIVVQDGHREILTLYSRFRYKLDNPTVIEITCNDMMLPYLFELQKNYTTYMIGNIAKLNSVSKIRFYEICKQYEKIGTIQLDLYEFQSRICVNSSCFKYFRKNTLEPAIKDINEYTDIKVSYDKILNCRKVVALKFTITKKDVLADIIDLPELTENTDTLSESVQSTNLMVDDRIINLYYDLDKVYSTDELKQLLNICKSISSKPEAYLKNVYYQIRARKKKISNLFSYTLAVINAELRKTPPESKKAKKRYSF